MNSACSTPPPPRITPSASRCWAWDKASIACRRCAGLSFPGRARADRRRQGLRNREPRGRRAGGAKGVRGAGFEGTRWGRSAMARSNAGAVRTARGRTSSETSPEGMPERRADFSVGGQGRTARLDRKPRRIRPHPAARPGRALRLFLRIDARGARGGSFKLVPRLQSLRSSRPKARAGRALAPPDDRDRGQGVGAAAHPGPDRRRALACRALRPERRRGHAASRLSAPGSSSSTCR